MLHVHGRYNKNVYPSSKIPEKTLIQLFFKKSKIKIDFLLILLYICIPKKKLNKILSDILNNPSKGLARLFRILYGNNTRNELVKIEHPNVYPTEKLKLSYSIDDAVLDMMETKEGLVLLKDGNPILNTKILAESDAGLYMNRLWIKGIDDYLSTYRISYHTYKLEKGKPLKQRLKGFKADCVLSQKKYYELNKTENFKNISRILSNAGYIDFGLLADTKSSFTLWDKEDMEDDSIDIKIDENGKPTFYTFFKALGDYHYCELKNPESFNGIDKLHNMAIVLYNEW